ncbi:hypothetical protein KIW84_043726 [Lathyrus oleraceus]|uniref:Uncharacterized protein n=1 Tax=Pisum sativum TaxID=3888 RepID=A0A9D4XIR9_PEA|nr:hypothetical protein KIW84_043726 [Pisum sativum]
MESENNLKQKQKLGVFDILKEAITLYVRNLNFIIFTFLTSLPLFCIMVYFEIQLQKTLIEIFYIVVNIPKEDILDGYFGYMLDLMSREYYYLKFIQLGLIYILPLHVLEFGTAIVTINLASKLSSQQENNMSLKEMFQNALVVCNGVKDVFGMDFYVELESCSFSIGGFSCYYIGGYEQGNGTFIQVALFCMLIPLKWVVFMIYFHDCKERYLEKKTDEELGKDVRVPQK